MSLIIKKKVERLEQRIDEIESALDADREELQELDDLKFELIRFKPHLSRPKKIRMLKTVHSDLPFINNVVAIEGKEYKVQVNQHGAISAILENGQLLGVKPGECEIIE